MLFTKKDFICKEKSRTSSKVKLVTKITKMKKHYLLILGTLVLALYCYSRDNVENTDFFQNTNFKESSSMQLKQISEQQLL